MDKLHNTLFKTLPNTPEKPISFTSHYNHRKWSDLKKEGGLINHSLLSHYVQRIPTLSTQMRLDSKTIQKAMLVGLEQFSNLASTGLVEICDGSSIQSFLLIKQDENLRITHLNFPEVLGSGSFGKVSKVYSLVIDPKSQTASVEMDIRKDVVDGTPDIKKAQDSFMTEYNTLTDLHRKFPRIKGLQKAPHTVVEMINEGKKQFFCLAPFYNGGDGEKALNDKGSIGSLSAIQKVKNLKKSLADLVAALNQSSTEYANLDFKPENLFVSKDDNDDVSIDLADWGGAVSMRFLLEACKEGKGMPSLSASKNFIPFSLLKAIKKAYVEASDAQKAGKPADAALDNLKGLFKKIQLFSLGSAMYMMMTGKLPYELDYNDYPIPKLYDSFDDALKEKGYGRHVADALRLMLDFDASNITEKGVSEIYQKVINCHPQH